MNDYDYIIDQATSTIDVDLQQYFGGYYADMLPDGDA